MDVLPFSLLGSWRNLLWQGEHIIGHIGDLSGRDKRLMKKLDFSSVLLLPIGEPGNWAGVIGFGEIIQRREWEDNDIKLLRTVAQMIYAYLERVRNAQVVAEARDEALTASQFKSELLAKVSHELRTPLGAIMGYAQLLSFGSNGNLTDDQGEATDLIIGSSKYLASLVNGILDQAQLESGQLTLVYLPYNVRNLVNDVESIIRVLAEDKGLKFEVVISPEIPEEQRGDQTRLQQVLTNLLGNSVKFTERGTISLYVYLCLRKICFEITDTGIGIPFEAQSKIFESFTQVDGSTTRRTSGTGLGLSISKQLVDMMNGQIKLTSRVGIGSTFIVELPRTEPSNESHPKNDTTARIQYGKRSGIDCRR
jgi:signal transduction histidine kinase